jgi:hypothetical protein
MAAIDTQTLQIAVSFLGGGLVTELLRRVLDKRQRVASAKSKLVAAITKLEIDMDGLEQAFGSGGTTTDVVRESKALTEFALAIGEARLELPAEIIAAATLVYVEWDQDLEHIASGRYPSWMLPDGGDLAVDPIEHLLKLLGAKSSKRFRANAEDARKLLPKVPPPNFVEVKLSPKEEQEAIAEHIKEQEQQALPAPAVPDKENAPS